MSHVKTAMKQRMSLKCGKSAAISASVDVNTSAASDLCQTGRPARYFYSSRP